MTALIPTPGRLSLKRVLKKLFASRLFLLGVASPLVAFGAPVLLFLFYIWGHVLLQDLPGGRHGPLDAYRHTLASAVLAFVFDGAFGQGAGSRAIEVVIFVMENGELRSNIMDRHNNRLGSRIGSHAPTFADIEPAVAQAVAKGNVMATSPDQVTWLPEHDWRPGIFW